MKFTAKYKVLAGAAQCEGRLDFVDDSLTHARTRASDLVQLHHFYMTRDFVSTEFIEILEVRPKVRWYKILWNICFRS